MSNSYAGFVGSKDPTMPMVAQAVQENPEETQIQRALKKSR